MPHRKRSRINLDLDLFNKMHTQKKNKSIHKTYDWEKQLPKETLERNKWLAKVWLEVYSKNPENTEIRYLSTVDMLETNWYEKYGYKEPNKF